MVAFGASSQNLNLRPVLIMQKILFAFLLIVYLAAANGTVTAQAAKRTATQQIDTYCKSVEKFTIAQEKAALIFADTSGDEGGKPKWKKFASQEAHEKFRESSETYEIAYAWRRNSRLVAANFTYFSESGDWAKYVNHCFRADGSLAKVSIDYRTFYGDFILLKDMYFSTAGRLLKVKSKTLDLTTHEPKKVGRDYLDENAGHINSVGYYMSVGKLPFAHLLKPKKN